MGWLSDITGIDIDLGQAANWAGEQFDNITGASQADAAQEAGQLQYQATQQGIANQQAAQQQMREDLMPFTQFGTGMIGGAQQAYDQSAGLFGPNAGEQVMNNPMFQAIQGQVQNDILSNQAVRGRLGTGETPMFMQDAALRTGFDILGSERNAALQNRASMMQALGLGQSSVAQVGQSGMASAGNIANLLGQGANAQAGGIMGAANAGAQGTQNLIGLGTTLASLGMGAMGGGAGASAGGGMSYNPSSLNFSQPQVGTGFGLSV